ncbi:MAG TPA: hypothetical protein PLJ93_01670 [Candidatus Mcinerneyibacteriales bacterium]|nr:hypothetical protein [Candidatus Mcinerneyibacteriales bacterium]
MKKIIAAVVLLLMAIGTFIALTQKAEAIKAPPRKNGTVRTENGSTSCVAGGTQCYWSPPPQEAQRI